MAKKSGGDRTQRVYVVELKGQEPDTKKGKSLGLWLLETGKGATLDEAKASLMVGLAAIWEFTPYVLNSVLELCPISAELGIPPSLKVPVDGAGLALTRLFIAIIRAKPGTGGELAVYYINVQSGEVKKRGKVRNRERPCGLCWLQLEISG